VSIYLNTGNIWLIDRLLIIMLLIYDFQFIQPEKEKKIRKKKRKFMKIMNWKTDAV